MADAMTGRVALVTGAGAGIGRATAIAFANEGARVVVSDVDDAGGEETASMIRDAGGDAIYVHCDVSRQVEVEALIGRAIEAFDRLDYAFNNAGIEGHSNSTAECSEDNWDRVIDINLKGVWLCMKYEIPELLRQGGGSIVNCSSIAGVIGFSGIPAYTASKHGILGLTKTAALDYAEQGIRINAICPGVIRTKMVERFTGGSDDAASELASGAPMARMGTPEEIASAVIWLCSDGAGFVTGHPLIADGGWVAR